MVMYSVYDVGTVNIIVIDYWKLGWFHLLCSICCFSIATPPDLKDWTKMAETYDNLTNSVSIRSPMLAGSFYPSSSSFYIFLFHSCYEDLLIFVGEDCYGGKVCWPYRFISVCSEGVMSYG